jgi:hypothetical protein
MLLLISSRIECKLQLGWPLFWVAGSDEEGGRPIPERGREGPPPLPQMRREAQPMPERGRGGTQTGFPEESEADPVPTPAQNFTTTLSGPLPGQDSLVERLQEQIEILEIRAGRAEQMVQDEHCRRRQALKARLSTGLTQFFQGLMAYARPRIAIPWTFKGSYNELVNVLNWIYTVAWYLDQCRVDHEDWSGFASTYMHSTVQAWMDVMKAFKSS